MDFGFSEEQALLRRSIRDFAETVIAPRVQWMEDTDEKWPRWA
jgi:alkylation response protein AidB-like acyl-CoA dehydrogenase